MTDIARNLLRPVALRALAFVALLLASLVVDKYILSSALSLFGVGI